MKKSKVDGLLEFWLYVLGLCLCFEYIYISIDRWLEFPFMCIFCGLFFYLSLVRLVCKRKKRKFDYVVPILNLIISTPGGQAFDCVVKIILRLCVGVEIGLELLLLVWVGCWSVWVIATVFMVVGLMFWEEVIKKKEV